MNEVGLFVCSLQFGMLAVFPNLYNCNPVSAIVIMIDALWKTLYSIFCFFASSINCVCVVAERESPYTNRAMFFSFASFRIDSSSTAARVSSVIFTPYDFSSSLIGYGKFTV